jgi:hypothetical protein
MRDRDLDQVNRQVAVLWEIADVAATRHPARQHVSGTTTPTGSRHAPAARTTHQTAHAARTTHPGAHITHAPHRMPHAARTTHRWHPPQTHRRPRPS